MKEKKDGNTVNRNRIFLFIVVALIIAYIFYAIYLLIKQPTDTFTVEIGTLYLEESAEGYIIRKETVVKGDNYKNGMEQIVPEGEKAAKGQAIFRYYSNDETNLKDKIAELDVKIQEALEQENTSIYSSDLKILEGQIDDKVKNLSEIKDINNIVEIKKEISDLVIKKAKMAGELSPSGSHIKQLIEERGQYESELNSGSEYVEAPNSGVVSYRVDGLEDVLGNVELSNLNQSYLENLNLKTGKMIATSNEEGKIIDNFSCYIATYVNSDKAREAKIGDSVTVALSGNKELDAKIAYVKPEENGKNLIVVEVSELTNELIDYRKVSFDLIWWSYSGLKIPNKAIIEENGLQYVVRSRAGYLDKLLIKVLRQNDDYSIVTSYSTDDLKQLGYNTQDISSYKKITVYDEIVLNPIVEKLK